MSRLSLKRGKIIAFAGFGAGYGSLVCDGMIGAFLDEKGARKFLAISVFLLVASLIWLDPIIESVYATYGVQSKKALKGWRGVRVAVIATFLFVFLHKALDSELEKNWREALPIMTLWALYAGFITWAWLSGARLRPSRCARNGAWAGILIALILAAFSLLIHARSTITGMGYRVAIAELTFVAVGAAWPIVLGYAGGWVIDRSGRANISRRILCALVICSLGLTVVIIANWFILFSFLHSYLIARAVSPDRISEISEKLWAEFAGAIGLGLVLSLGAAAGWGLGLAIHSETCDSLMAGSRQLSATRPPKTAKDGL